MSGTKSEGDFPGSRLVIRDYRSADARALTDLFYETIHEVGIEHYTREQVLAWAPLPIDYEWWQERLDGLPPFVGEVDGVIAGFITLAEDGKIEWTYTHKEYQRRGIASALYTHMEQVARERGLLKLSVHASRFARPFFAKRGFRVLSREEAFRFGQALEYWSMEKSIDPAMPGPGDATTAP